MNQQRVDKVLANLEKMGLSQVFVCDPVSIRYLCGYDNHPMERFYGLYLSPQREVMFCNKLFPDASAYCENVVTFTDTDDPIPMLAEVCDHTTPLGIDKVMTASWLLPLMQSGAASAYVAGSPAVDHARAIKDAEEQELMRKASRINDEAIGWLAQQVHEGVTEREVAGMLAAKYRELGSDHSVSAPIVCFGATASDPHHSSDGTVFHKGDMFLFDMGCHVQEYRSDMTRTFFSAEPTARQREIYEIVLEAQLAAEAIVKPGVLFSEIDDAARNVITEAGYGEFFTHRTGHQIGLQTHEPGDVSSTHHEPIEPGMIFSIEPGIYLVDEIGVRIEDLILVTEDGCEILNSFPKEILVYE